MSGSNYVCTEWRFVTVPIVATNNNRNILLIYTNSNSVPPKFNSYKHALLSKFTNTIAVKCFTGATGRFIRYKYSVIFNYLQHTTTSPLFRLPDNSVIQPTHSGHLPLSILPPVSTQAHAYLNIKSYSLLSIGQLCDSDCSALFTKSYVATFNSDKTPVLNGKHNISNILWDVKCHHHTPHHPPLIPHKLCPPFRWNKSKLASYLNAAAGCLTKLTFIQSINNSNFITWPGLSTNLISKHLLPSLPTLKVNFNQEHQNFH